ncbi:reticulocyte-binding protein 2-like a [Plakobranchus ocellatus]|uniref:Reticulocyte-binding protein 2-like a n=1 Tax=Plakobranchus ocellatus TaxID=259542 RepID=A0AAV3Y0B5_9GAST|nr:reticulocyte-binding protein 2-like a [Plakobranchus ocellatus]
MGEPEQDLHTKLKLEEECVVCLAAPACMQTFPCGHKVVCRKCLIKTIQVAVSQRCLPLRCVICRNRILRLQHTSAKGSAITHHQQSQKQQQAAPTNSSNSGPSSLYKPGSFIAPGCATAGALTLTPIVFRSLGSSGPDHQSMPIGAISPGTLQSCTGRQKWAKGPHVTFSGITLEKASSFDDQPGYSRDCPATHEMGYGDDLWKRSYYPAADMEAFVHSHNDALNLHSTKPQASNSISSNLDENVHYCDNTHHSTGILKSNASWKARSCFAGKKESSHVLSGSKTAGAGNSPALGFMHGQAVKIHPETIAQPSAFMMSPEPDGSEADSVDNHVISSPSRFPKNNISASKFIAKFLPKSSRRMYNWFRHE